MAGVEYASVTGLVKALGGVPRDLRAELRPRLRAAGAGLQSAVKANASWSSRIPAAVRISTRFSGSGGVRVYVATGNVPHARPYENRGRPGFFRHPVYGNREVWVSQAARPFFAPAVDAEREKVRALVAAAVRASFPTVRGML